MIDFQLFRIKVILPTQKDIWEETNRTVILRESITEGTSAELRKGRFSHIGNVEQIDNDAVYFRFGRTTTTTLEVFKKGRFLDQDFETAPYTHVLFDLELELVAIARKSKLANTPLGIARQLVRLLQETSPHKKMVFEISPIKDPTSFIEYLGSAQSISMFTVWFSRPNPIDVEEDFIKPSQRLLNESGGRQGKTELKGEELDANALEAISRSAAATGDDAVAVLKTSEGTSTRKRLGDNPVVVKHEDLADTTAKSSLLARIRDLFHSIRNRRGGE